MGCILKKIGGLFVHKGCDKIQVGSHGKLGEKGFQNLRHGIIARSKAGDLGKVFKNMLGMVFSRGAGNVNVIGASHGAVGGKADPAAVFQRLTQEIVLLLFGVSTIVSQLCVVKPKRAGLPAA